LAFKILQNVHIHVIYYLFLYCFYSYIISMIFSSYYILFRPILSYPFPRILKNLIHGPFLFLSRPYLFLYKSYFLIQVLFFWHIFQKFLVFPEFFQVFPSFSKFFLCSQTVFPNVFDTVYANDFLNYLVKKILYFLGFFIFKILF
jgi:hypothetical protein